MVYVINLSGLFSLGFVSMPLAFFFFLPLVPPRSFLSMIPELKADLRKEAFSESDTDTWRMNSLAQSERLNSSIAMARVFALNALLYSVINHDDLRDSRITFSTLPLPFFILFLASFPARAKADLVEVILNKAFFASFATKWQGKQYHVL